MPYVKGRFIDENGRSHEWSGDVASSDRNQIKSQIKAQTGARQVHISGVYNSNSSNYDEYRRQHNEDENRRRKEQLDRLQSGSQTKSQYNSSNSSYSNNNNSSPSSSIDPGSALVLLGICAGVWAFIAFMPWILMGLYGAGATWISEKMTGQSVEDFGNNDNPTDDQNLKALIVFAAAIFFGGLGFVQGSGWQNELNKDTKTTQPQAEQVIKK